MIARQDPFPGPARTDELAACEREWDDYVTVSRFVETRRIFYQLPIREGISLIVRIGIMMMVGWWVHVGQVSIGEYILFTQLAGRANDPLYVFFGMQQQIMTTRESLRRLGLLCGIDFGIRRPEAAPAKLSDIQRSGMSREPTSGDQGAPPARSVAPSRRAPRTIPPADIRGSLYRE